MDHELIDWSFAAVMVILLTVRNLRDIDNPLWPCARLTKGLTLGVAEIGINIRA
jgi:hypothetical protein